jgi:hypothetical protein
MSSFSRSAASSGVRVRVTSMSCTWVSISSARSVTAARAVKWLATRLRRLAALPT